MLNARFFKSDYLKNVNFDFEILIHCYIPFFMITCELNTKHSTIIVFVIYLFNESCNIYNSLKVAN